MTSRYDRQALIIGRGEQAVLEKKLVTVLGVGALGSVAAELLVRAGVSVKIIDRDIVELDNLQRQTLYAEADVGEGKVFAAKKRLQKINSTVKILAKAIDVNEENADCLESDLILDCVDNQGTRYLIDEYATKQKIPWVHGAAIQEHGEVLPLPVNAHRYSEVMPHKTTGLTCAAVGVLNTITTIIASLQVQLALDLLLKKKVEQKLYRVSVNPLSITPISIKKVSEPVAVPPLSISALCGKNTYQIRGRAEDYTRLGGSTGVVNKDSVSVFPDGRAIVKASSESEAKQKHAKIVGH